MMKLIDKIGFVVSLAAAIALMGAYIARYINPNTFVVPSLLGLAYPYLLLANLLLLLYWTARLKRTVFLHLAVFALGIPSFLGYYGVNRRPAPEPAGDIDILSYNIRYFDRYDWNGVGDTKAKLLAFLNHHEFDILCLQEIPARGSGGEAAEYLDRIRPDFYRYIQRSMAIFSRYPILVSEEIPFPEESTGTGIYCDVLFGVDTIRVFDIHLESYKLGKKERRFVREISRGESHDVSGGVKNIVSRLTAGNKNRATQAVFVKSEIAKSPYPVIVGGDFNDTPLSYTYRIVAKGLSDSFLEKGRGLGNTYIGEFPSFRIDYLLHSHEYEAISYNRDTVTLSDHYPISCSLRKRPIKRTGFGTAAH